MLPPYQETLPAVERTAVLPRIADGFEPPVAPPVPVPVPVPSSPVSPPRPPAQPPAQPATPPRPPVRPVVTAATVPAAPGAAQTAAQAAAQAPAGMAGGPRGRILVVEGGYGGPGRRPWGRAGAGHAPVLSAMLAAVSPQILLAADAVDAVHLPGATDPQSVLAHLRAAARHPGPLLIHLGGHLVTDRRAEYLYLTLRDTKGGSLRQDALPWQAVAEELRHRPAEWGTLVVADLSADQAAWPQLQSSISPLKDGLPLWAVVSPDPDRVGTFTRALIEALHGGRPGEGPVLSPEQLRGQVHSVLRPDVILFSSYPADRPVFRNTARVLAEDNPEPKPWDGPRPSAVMPKPANRTARQRPVAKRVLLSKDAGPGGGVGVGSGAGAPARRPGDPVTLLKPGVPPTPPRPPRPVSLLKRTGATGGAAVPAPAAGTERVATPTVSFTKSVTAQDTSAQLAPAQPAAEPVGARVSFAKAAATQATTTPPPAGARVSFGKAAAQQAARSVPEPRPEAEQGVSLAKRLPAAEAAAPAQPVSEPVDYREAIGRIVRCADAGEHDTAIELVLELEQSAVAAHGPLAPEVLQVRQVRAHVSRLAGLPALAALLYREVALTLLRSEGPEHPETQRAATNAEACWRAVPDRAEAIRLAPEIIELRAHLPGPDGRKLRASERYLKQLVAAQSESAR
ncbi:hypothetical protein GCM10009760_40530 [Kitasatospora kazusensis]|uniref:Tetratricopeptide repeat protein n=1 Tax=Kitasatospora kazusensis TaxID=407974 RepID=A0ABN2ZWW5_9ACTN